MLLLNFRWQYLGLGFHIHLLQFRNHRYLICRHQTFRNSVSINIFVLNVSDSGPSLHISFIYIKTAFVFPAPVSYIKTLSLSLSQVNVIWLIIIRVQRTYAFSTIIWPISLYLPTSINIYFSFTITPICLIQLL
jgi:hypothetical protein